MIDTTKWISDLAQRGVRFQLEGDRVRFSAPPGQLSGQELTELRHRKDELLEWLQTNRSSGAASEIKVSAPILDSPLSHQQLRLFFLWRLDPSDASYNMPYAFRLEGSLNIDTLEKSINDIVRRHRILSTRLYEGDDQVIARYEDQTVSLKPIDASRVEIDQRLARCARMPFDLLNESLTRWHLFREDEHTHVLFVMFHHIIFDGGSMDLLKKEIVEIYRARLHQYPANLPHLRVQYSEYSKWQRENSRENKPHLDYWLKRLAPPWRVIDLPGDGPRAGTSMAESGSITITLKRQVTEQLRELCKSHNVTLFMVLLAAYKVFVARLTGESDILIGIPINGRSHMDTENLIGFFVNTLVIRSAVSPTSPFSDYLKEVREVVLEAFDHQSVQFEQIVEEINPLRLKDRHPVFQLFFNFIHTSREDRKPYPITEDLRMCSQGTGFSQSKFDLAAYVVDDEENTSLTLAFKKTRFAENRIEEMARQYNEVLTQIVGNIDLAIGQISLETTEFRAKLIQQGVVADAETEIQAKTKSGEEGEGRRIKEKILEVVYRHPERPAVSCFGCEMNYIGLANAARKIAKTIVNLSSVGAVVGVTGIPSTGMFTAIVAVIMSRRALFTLDQQLPIEVQKERLDHAKVLILITVGSETTTFHSERIGLSVSELDGGLIGGVKQGKSAGTQAFGDLHREVAYLFFTSGSTGVPKCILGSHSGLSHFIDWQRKTFDIGPDDRCAQLAGLSFDVILRDVFLPLTSGAALVIPNIPTSDPRILSWLEEEKITVIHTVPSIVNNWLKGDPEGGSLSRLRYVFMAGEPLTSDLVRRWREAFPESGQVINLYGPTETTLAKCSYVVPGNEELYDGVQPIGKPLPGAQVLVLNKTKNLCGAGEKGEIVIRTHYRSYGYLNNEEENRKRFRRNHFIVDADVDDLLYYTGDLGRYRFDGVLEILGRLDSQVKINGVRIETGEIESRLRSHPDIFDCCVCVKQNWDGEESLVAYYIVNSNRSISGRELREFLRSCLAKDSMPSALVPIERFPLNVNGKIDRNALPEPAWEQRNRDSHYVAPKTPLEIQIASVWASFLKLKSVGLNDHFFDLGGHSMLATRVIGRLNKTLGKELPVRFFFDFPHLGEFASAVRTELIEGGYSKNIERDISGISERKKRMFVIPGIGGNIFVFRQLFQSLKPFCEALALQPKGIDGKETPCESVEELAEYYISQMKSMQPEGPYYLLGWCFGGVVAYEMSRRLLDRGEQIRLLGMVDTRSPYKEVPASGEGRGFATSVMKEFLKMLSRGRHSTWEYFGERIAGRLRLLIHRLRWARIRLYRTLGIQMPALLREHELMYIDGGMRRKYRPRSYNGDIFLLWSEDDPEWAGNTRTRRLFDPRTAQSGWDRLVDGDVHLRMFRGDHISMFSEMNVENMVAFLKEAMEEGGLAGDERKDLLARGWS